MSLQVWLPLNGSLENRGCSDVVVSNNGATVDNSGKIGKCYYFDGNDDYVEIAGISQYLTGNTPFSICFWIKHLENGTRAILFSSYGTPSTSKYFALELNSGSVTNNTLRVNYNGVDIDYGGVVDKEKWVHVTVTYDNSKIYKYIDGVLKKTIDYTLPTITETQLFRLGRDSRTGTTALKGYLNDFRFYDHCLSPKEVHEIAQGLVLHYPLNNIGGRVGNENYFKDSATGKSYKSNASSTYTDMRMYLDSSFWTDYGTSSNTYTVSFDWELSTPINKDCTVAVYWGQSPYTRLGDLILPANTTSGHYTYTKVWTRSSTFTPSNVFLRLGSTSGTSWLAENPGITFLCFNYKLEINNKETPWCPNVADPEYAALGYNSNVVSDCSGYGNDGTIYGTPTIETDSAVYNSSTKFNGSTGYITANGSNIANIINNQQCTVSYWMSPINISITNLETPFCCGSSAVKNKFFLCHYQQGVVKTCFYSNDQTTEKSFTNGQWYHIVHIINNGTRSIYCNGVLLNTASYTTPPSIDVNNAIIGIGRDPIRNSYFSNSYMSDVRVYSTALSEEDVKALYQQGASIDNLGSMHTYGEFNEGQEKISIGKNKVVSEGSVNEEGNKTSFHSDSTLVTKEINEE